MSMGYKGMGYFAVGRVGGVGAVVGVAVVVVARRDWYSVR